MPTYRIEQYLQPKPGAEVLMRERLIEAANKNAAIRHVAKDSIHAETCTVIAAMRLATEGVKVEKVGE